MGQFGTSPELRTPPQGGGLPVGKQALVEQHRDQLDWVQSEVRALQDRCAQLRILETQTREFARENYGAHPEAVATIERYLDFIFSDVREPVKASFTVPQRIEQLLATRPGIFTFFPGIGTHRTVPHGEIVLVGRHSTLISREEVDLRGEYAPGVSTSLPFFIAPMRASIGTELAEQMIAQGLTPIFHRFRRPLNPDDVDGPSPTVQSREEALAERQLWIERFGEQAFFSCGIDHESLVNLDTAKAMIAQGVRGICVDVAIGNSDLCVAAIIELKEYIRSGGYDSLIMAGNVETAEGYLWLAKAGADIIKVGIGPGSACTTRKVTGAGAGQGSALMDVAAAKFLLGAEAPSFIADGGIEGPKDILVALALGACGAMSGKLAAKTDESPALKRQGSNGQLAWYFGEASSWARVYEQGNVKPGMAVEGAGGWIPCSGNFSSLMKEISGGLRNALPYYDSRTIAELQRRFSIPQQLCRLITGSTTGIHEATPGFQTEAQTRLT